MSAGSENGEKHVESSSSIRVSVIIPTRNRAALLADVLKALEKQRFPSDAFEVFVMDNVSTDNTEDVVQAFAERVPFPVRFHRMARNGGPVPARNLGASLAKGEILAFTDSDCRPCPEWLERGTAAFEEGVGLVTGPVTYKPEQHGSFFSKQTAETLVEHPTYPTANAFYRKTAFEELGGFDGDLCFVDPLNRAVECADSDLAWRIIKSGYRNVFVKDLWVFHEIEEQTPWSWALEPTRLFVLPELVRRHPELRERLLFKRVVFYRGALPYYIAPFVALPLAILDWRWLLLAPAVLILRSFMKMKGPSPRSFVRAIHQVSMSVVRNYVLCVTMVYGSIRFRTLVL